MQTDWTQILQYSFERVWVEFIAALPQIFVAIIILIVGWILANLLKKLVIKIAKALEIDAALDIAGVDTVTERAGYRLNSGVFLGTLVKWLVLIVFFIAALDILNLDQATEFLGSVMAYLPNVIVAVLILLIGTILAGFVRKVVVASGRATRFGSPQLLGKVAYAAILTFTVLAALNQLRVAEELVQMLFAGLVFGLSLAFGLAFGLGGKEVAGAYLRKISGGPQQ